MQCENWAPNRTCGGLQSRPWCVLLPNLQQLGKLSIGETAEECLACDLRFEVDVQRPKLVEAITLCEAEQDYVSRELLEELLEDCEEAIDWLETQHSLIAAVTLPNYLQQQIGE